RTCKDRLAPPAQIADVLEGGDGVKAAIVDGPVFRQPGSPPRIQQPAAKAVIGRRIGSPPAPLDMQTDEGSVSLVPLATVLREPVGVDEARGVVLGSGDHSGEESLLLGRWGMRVGHETILGRAPRAEILA